LSLPIKETPDVHWDDPAKTAWANVGSDGAKPNDRRDDTAAIQAGIDSGKTTVYFPVGSDNVSKTILIRKNVRRPIGTEVTVEVPKTVNPGFKVVAGKNPVAIMRHLHSKMPRHERW